MYFNFCPKKKKRERERFLNELESLPEIMTCFNSDAGELYAKKLSNFVEKRLKSERAVSVSFISMINHLISSFRYM